MCGVTDIGGTGSTVTDIKLWPTAGVTGVGAGVTVVRVIASGPVFDDDDDIDESDDNDFELL